MTVANEIVFETIKVLDDLKILFTSISSFSWDSFKSLLQQGRLENSGLFHTRLEKEVWLYEHKIW